MRKEIKKWADSRVIVLTKEDLKAYDLREGDIVEIPEIKLIKRRGMK